jgi:hypothetical protein
MKNSVEQELVGSRTGDSSTESCDSVHGAEMRTAASGSARQEDGLMNLEGKQSGSDPQKEESCGQLTARMGARAVTEMGDGVEDGHLHKSVVEKVSVA